MRDFSFRDNKNIERCIECGVTVALCECVDHQRMAMERLFSKEGAYFRGVTKRMEELESNLPPSLYIGIVRRVGDIGENLINFTQGDPVTAKMLFQATQDIVALTALLGIYGDPDYDYNPGVTLHQDTEE